MDYIELINLTRDYQSSNLSSNEKALIYRIINAEASTYRIALSKFRFRQQNSQERNDYAILKRLIELRYIEENQEQRKILGGSMIYRFTTHGLLYIFTNKLIYPPQLLLNYSMNTLIRTLVFRYFETKTIGQGTARFYETLTEYLNECARLLTNQNFFYLESNLESHDMIENLIVYELGELIKSFVFKLAFMYSESNILTVSTLVENDIARVSLYELESSMKSLIASDRKFMQFLTTAKGEFDKIR